ncbi:uncharacterized protein L203_102292 [Cryptococcus depauperatus CBS 7841]|uniref:Uncharacterized protein n=1 Tax=Cryptococcus depauperatus CBS 7841 TaxID=1295531 RepID=A0AAJ8JRN8_9TREE
MRDSKQLSKMLLVNHFHSSLVSQDDPDALTEREYDELRFGPEPAYEYLKREADAVIKLNFNMTKRLLAERELAERELTSDAATGTRGADSVGDVDLTRANEVYRTALRSTVEWIKSNYKKPDSARTSVTSLLEPHQ